jgi:hypothetical protein
MAQANKHITLNTENQVVLNTEHEEALKDLARLMVEADRQWITQMEYDLTPDKAHNVQFFIRHWGSWAQAVEQAKAYMHLQQEFAPKPSEYSGYVQCLCGKALHCEEKFWSPDRRRIRMCDSCRAWSDGITVDESLLYISDDSPSGRSAALKAQAGQRAAKAKEKEEDASSTTPPEARSTSYKTGSRSRSSNLNRCEKTKKLTRK